MPKPPVTKNNYRVWREKQVGTPVGYFHRKDGPAIESYDRAIVNTYIVDNKFVPPKEWRKCLSRLK